MYESPVDTLDRAHWDAILAAGPWEDAPVDDAFADDGFTPSDGERLAAVLARVDAGWVDPGLATALGQIDVAGLTADEAVTYAQVWQRVVASAMAGRDAGLAAVNDRLVRHFGARDAADASALSSTLQPLNIRRVNAGRAPLRTGAGAGLVPPEQAALHELGAALRLAPRSTDAAVAHAIDLVGPWAPLLDALRTGAVTDQHVKAISKWLGFLPTTGSAATRGAYAAQCARILDVVIPYAATHTPGEAGRKTKVLVLTADPAGARERRREAAEREHGVSLTPTEPGTCQVVATMPLAHGEAILSAVNALAKNPDFETAPGCVTKGQRQVAALATLVLGDPGAVVQVDSPVAEAKVRAHVSVVFPLSMLTAVRAALGPNAGARRADGAVTRLTDDTTTRDIDALPGGRIGAESVPADVIREVLADAAADSTIRRLVTDQVGTVIDIGRAHYSPTGLQQRLIRLRDGTCRFPGCTQRAEHCDIDHATPWDTGGQTNLDNLGALCRYHHQAKTHGGWQITRSARSGACIWRSPLGRIYHHDPGPLTPPAPDTSPF